MEQNKRMANDAELKEAVKFLADAELLVSEVTGGFSFAEIGQLITVANDVPPIIKDAGVMFPEWKSLDDAARADMVAYVQANCKFPANVAVEAFVEKLLSAIVMLSSLFGMFQAKAA